MRANGAARAKVRLRKLNCRRVSTWNRLRSLSQQATFPRQFIPPDLAQKAVTDQNGHFFFETVTPGSYEAFAEEDAFEGSAPPESGRHKDATNVELGRSEHKNIRLELAKH